MILYGQRVKKIMSRLLFIIVGIIVVGIFNDVLETITGHFIKKEPPKTIRIVEKSEVIFGALVLMSSVYFIFIEQDIMYACFSLTLGFFWLFIAMCLYMGKNWARIICLVLSIVRIPTIIGIPFSVFSFYTLFFSKKYKTFFMKEDEKLSF